MRKINIFRYFGVIVITLLLASCSKKEHFITDKTYRETVHQDFLARQELAQHREKELFDILETENLTLQESFFSTKHAMRCAPAILSLGEKLFLKRFSVTLSLPTELTTKTWILPECSFSTL